MTSRTIIAHARSSASLIVVAAFAGVLTTGCAANLGTGSRLAARGEHAEVKVSGQGVVESDGGEIDCGAVDGEARDACRAEWIDWDQVSMTATPAPGWRFAGWRTSDHAAPYAGEHGPTTFTYEAVFVPRHGTAQASAR